MTEDGKNRKDTKAGRKGGGGHKYGTASKQAWVQAEIARLDRRGLTHSEIARAVDLSPAMVPYYLKKIRARYAQAILQEREGLVEEKLYQYRDIRAEAWLAWDRSQLDLVRTTKEVTTSPPRKEKGNGKGTNGAGQQGPTKGKTRIVKGPDGRMTRAEVVEDMMTSQERLKTIVTREGRLPNNEYLTTVIRTLEAERKLLGLDEPEKVQAQVFTWDMLARKAATEIVPEDMVEQRMERLLPPAGPPVPIVSPLAQQPPPATSPLPEGNSNGTHIQAKPKLIEPKPPGSGVGSNGTPHQPEEAEENPWSGADEEDVPGADNYEGPGW